MFGSHPHTMRGCHLLCVSVAQICLEFFAIVDENSQAFPESEQ